MPVRALSCAGNDALDGGADSDTASYAGATGAVTAYLWNGQVTGADGTDTLTSIENLIGSGFNDRLDGTNTANSLDGGAGADNVYAYAGDDTLTGGAGNDTLDGGADADTASYADATGSVTVYLWGGQATGADGTDTLGSIENLMGSGFNKLPPLLAHPAAHRAAAVRQHRAMQAATVAAWQGNVYIVRQAVQQLPHPADIVLRFAGVLHAEAVLQHIGQRQRRVTI